MEHLMWVFSCLLFLLSITTLENDLFPTHVWSCHLSLNHLQQLHPTHEKGFRHLVQAIRARVPAHDSGSTSSLLYMPTTSLTPLLTTQAYPSVLAWVYTCCSLSKKYFFLLPVLILTTGLPQLTMGLLPDTHCKLERSQVKMHLVHLTYRTSS